MIAGAASVSQFTHSNRWIAAEVLDIEEGHIRAQQTHTKKLRGRVAQEKLWSTGLASQMALSLQEVQSFHWGTNEARAPVSLLDIHDRNGDIYRKGVLIATF